MFFSFWSCHLEGRRVFLGTALGEGEESFSLCEFFPPSLGKGKGKRQGRGKFKHNFIEVHNRTDEIPFERDGVEVDLEQNR